MDDRELLELFFRRDERALRACAATYGGVCRRLALRILGSREDAEEAENDAYLRAWNTIPPEKPLPLLPYLAALCRSAALDRLRTRNRQKRGGGVMPVALEELRDCVPGGGDGREYPDAIALRDALNAFLAGLDAEDRALFLRRYWWACGVREIAADAGLGESAVKMRLARLRSRLRNELEKEGLI